MAAEEILQEVKIKTTSDWLENEHQTDHPAKQPAEYPAEQPTEYPAEQPTECPAEQPTECPAEQPTECPAEQPAEEHTKQSSNEPSIQCRNSLMSSAESKDHLGIPVYEGQDFVVNIISQPDREEDIDVKAIKQEPVSNRDNGEPETTLCPNVMSNGTFHSKSPAGIFKRNIGHEPSQKGSCLSEDNTVWERVSHKNDRGKPRRCFICKKLFSNEEYLRKHMTRFHSVNQDVISTGTVKHEVFQKGPQLTEAKTVAEKTSVVKNEEGKPKRCFVCGKLFSQECFLEKHMKKFHSEHQYGTSSGNVKHEAPQEGPQLIQNKPDLEKPQLIQNEPDLKKPQLIQNEPDLEKPQLIQNDPDLKKPQLIQNDPDLEKPQLIQNDPDLEKPQLIQNDPDLDKLPDKNRRRIRCPICRKMFCSQNRIFERHLKKLHNISIRLHTRERDGQRLYECLMCEAQFTGLGRLLAHVKSHSGETPYGCSVCGKSLTSKYNLKAHMKIHAETQGGDLKPYACDLCDWKFDSEANLDKHMKTHSEETPYECGVCGKKFKLKWNCKRHEEGHGTPESGQQKLKNDEKPYGCSICDKRFDNKTSFANHLAIHSDARPYACTFCDRKFKTQAYLDSHMVKHIGVKRFGCSFCEKKFKRKSERIYHERLHHDGSGTTPENRRRLYECYVCNKKLVSQESLATHINTHSDKKRFKCSICGFAFYFKSGLATHMKVHSGEKPHGCSICDKKFGDKATLKMHISTHSEERPYACDLCEWRFKTKHLLRGHLKTHSSEKPYGCYFCDKKFKSQKNLSFHVRRHTEERQECSVCGQYFTLKRYLTKHMARRHAAKVEEKLD